MRLSCNDMRIPSKLEVTNKVALDDMFLQLQELSLKDPSVRFLTQ